ncbi:putative membrane protein (TIGR04086 family) [Desulfitispora alkaliphila]|uniref:TIGR04086 family membrane protein n=1 Tax=Desulfitispora alkaliphila TaxID=622674 RepID=UPI003D1E44DC
MDIRVILKGLAVSYILSIASIVFILFLILTSEEQNFYLPTYLALTNVVAVLVGGAIAGKGADNKWLEHGLIVAAGYFIIGYVIAIGVFPLTISVATILNVAILLVIGALGAGAGRVLKRSVTFFWSRKFDKLSSKG